MLPKGQPDRLLLIEDNPDHWAIIQAVLSHYFPKMIPVWVTKPQAAIDYLINCQNQQQPWPTLILLDLYLPDREVGLQLLQQIKARTANYCPSPVVALSHSASPHDVEAMYRAGCSSYLVKPVTIDGWHELIRQFKNYWWDTVTRPQGAFLTSPFYRR